MSMITALLQHLRCWKLLYLYLVFEDKFVCINHCKIFDMLHFACLNASSLEELRYDVEFHSV